MYKFLTLVTNLGLGNNISVHSVDIEQFLNQNINNKCLFSQFFLSLTIDIRITRQHFFLAFSDLHEVSCDTTAGWSLSVF